MDAKPVGIGASLQKKTLTGSKATKAGTNGHALRKLSSWIDAFIDYTADLESPEIFRRWAAIATIGATLEQKVWAHTTDKIYPNMYTFIVGHPGVGKSRTITAARKLCETIEGYPIGPQSVSKASLVDALKKSRRSVTNVALGISEEYNSMILFSDDWQVTMSEWNKELIAGLTTFYDVISSYSEMKRTKEIDIKIKAPQLNILAGSTPSQLMTTMPEGSWEQGFTSRAMFIFSDDRHINETAFGRAEKDPKDLTHDLHVINALWGQLGNSEEFIQRVDTWRKSGMPPVPNHPRLLHYNSRRFVHLLKLCIIACVDRGGKLIIDVGDFERAMKWLIEAEYFMPNLFQAGAGNADAKAMQEILYFVKIKGSAEEGEIIRFASDFVPVMSVGRILQTMVASRMIKAIGNHPKYGTSIFVVDQG
jgi:hypothetical protein